MNIQKEMDQIAQFDI